MEPEEYDRLMLATDRIEFPTRDAIAAHLRERFGDEVIADNEFACLVDAELVEELRARYSEAAMGVGLDAEQGLAMLEYAAIIRDLEDDGYGER
jgi:hypothetical protein